jgi:hypothetical protein
VIDTSSSDQTVQATLLVRDFLDDLVEARNITDVALVIIELAVEFMLGALRNSEVLRLGVVLRGGKPVDSMNWIECKYSDSAANQANYVPVAPASMSASAWTRPRPRAPPETMITLSFRLISGRTPGTGGLLPAALRAAGEVWNGRAEEVIAAPKAMGRLAIALRAGVNLDMMGGSCGRLVRGFAKNASLRCCGWREWNMQCDKGSLMMYEIRVEELGIGRRRKLRVTKMRGAWALRKSIPESRIRNWYEPTGKVGKD